MIEEGDIPSIQCKISLRRPKSMRKVNFVTLVFIFFYISALTPRLNRTDSLLQLSENINIFAVCRICTGATKEETYIDTRCLGLIIYIHDTVWGTGRNLVAPLPVYSLA
jgi:hypothetical protein